VGVLNADREKTCSVTFGTTPPRSGKRVDFDPALREGCSRHPGDAGWRPPTTTTSCGCSDAQGNAVLEFSEVESGIFEAPKPGEAILFHPDPTDLGCAAKTAEQITGDWTIVRRTGQRVCGMTLSNTAAGEEFVVRLQPPCDRVITSFGQPLADGPRRDRAAPRKTASPGASRRAKTPRWQRVPQTASPLLMVRK